MGSWGRCLDELIRESREGDMWSWPGTQQERDGDGLGVWSLVVALW